MVSVEESGLIMKVRAMISKFAPDSLRLKSPSAFFARSSIFAFCLTEVGVFCNHDLPPVG
jgi:hypothetical protein